MDVDIGDLFGDREAESAGGSDGESDREEHQPNLGEENEGQGVAGDEETAGGATAGQVIKIKKTVKNPQPKLDVHRLAGPRGLFALNKIGKNFKFKGKGHEREDLRELLKVLEHWAHRLYPKLPFKDTLEQIEKLGTQKSIQVIMKKLRLDMFTEGEEGEDNVRRGPDKDDSETTPVVDVFDELLGITPSAQPTTTTTTPKATTVPGQTTLLPASQPPRPNMLTPEQQERIERNKRLAIEKRLARLEKQQLEQRQQEQGKERDQNSIQQEITTSQATKHLDIAENLEGPEKSSSEENRREMLDTEELMDML